MDCSFWVRAQHNNPAYSKFVNLQCLFYQEFIAFPLRRSYCHFVNLRKDSEHLWALLHPHCIRCQEHGENNRSEVCVAAVGRQEGTIEDITDVQLHRILWAGLPFVYDDPSNVKQLKPLLMKAFGRGVIGSSKMATGSRTVPVICANDFIVQALSQEEERYAKTK